MVGAVTITLTDGAQIMIARVLVTMLSLSMPSAVFGEALHEQPRTPEQERALHEHEEEYEEAVRDAARRVGIELDPEVEPEGSGVYLRPLDDSDPEMRQRTLAYFEAVPCRDETSIWQCERAKQILRDGGDRLAHYLIRQVEANEAEGWPNQGTYVSLVGRTESPVAYAWARQRMLDLAAKWESGEGTQGTYASLIRTIEALGKTRMQAAADDAIALLERFPESSEISLRAVNAIDRVQSKHGAQPRAQEALRALRARLPESGGGDGESGPDGLRQQVESALANPGSTR